ncbi:hypothetical protein VTN00DRAFT_8282 [Thermoascus crustaceus]|uniref:uncharacterized protein n=1 Tax=Thermoascus crustaceus TaxID=5088 RepID=UPI003742C087
MHSTLILLRVGEEEEDPKTFPAPLLLPGDDLSLDPDCSPQIFQEWLEEEKDWNEVTAERNVIYVVPPPEVDRDVDFMRIWERSQQQQG